MCELDITNEDTGVIKIDSIDNYADLEFDIYNYYDQKVFIEIKEAENRPISIQRLKVSAANSINIEFTKKLYDVRVENLIILSPKVNYLGGANIVNLKIITEQELMLFASNIAYSILVEQIEDIDDTKDSIRNFIRGFNILPGTGEYILNPTRSIEKLKTLKIIYPNCEWISPIICWFADDLDIANCKISPGIDCYSQDLDNWNVALINKSNAHKILLINDISGEHTNYGSSIDDKSLVAFLSEAKKIGFKILFYPIIMVDKQDKPWRGYITGNPDSIKKFYSDQYEPFILHYANLVKDLADAFIIGSELVGLTRIKIKNIQNSTYDFPFVKQLIELSSEVRSIVGQGMMLTYAADWSEYHTADGYLRPLDELWAHKDIDFVGIDAYFPLSDSEKSNISVEEIKKGWISGEGYDYYYSNGEKISFNNEYCNAWKNLRYWWESEHYEYYRETNISRKTNWISKMKPIWFTEFGFPSIDKSSNRPNIFFDYQSRDAGVPKYSNGRIDFSIQRRALKATLEFWQDSDFVKNLFYWGFDIREEVWYKNTYYTDHGLWDYGHWIDGKIKPIECLTIDGDIVANNLEIKALKNCKINPLKIQVKECLKIYSSGNLEMCSRVITNGNILSSSQTQDLENVFIEAKEIYLEVKGDCISHSTNIITKAIYVKTYNLFFDTTITTDIFITSYSNKVLLGLIESKSYFKKDVIQKAHMVKILSESGNFEVEKLFTAKGSKIIMNNLEMLALDYDFSGVKLSSESFEKTSSRFLLSSDNSSKFIPVTEIEGVEFIIQGKCYIAAEGKIWIKASSIKAIDLKVKAKELIRIDGLVGSIKEESNNTKSGLRLCWNFTPGNYSIGAELYRFEENSTRYSEYLYPSILCGTSSLIIETEKLEQTGSIITGGSGEIKAKDWTATAPELKQDLHQSSNKVSLGAEFGIKENISPAIMSMVQTVDNVNSSTSNPFYGINLASSLYKNFRKATSLASGVKISAGPSVNFDTSFGSFESHSKEYWVNLVSFSRLKVKVENKIKGAIEIKADKLERIAGEYEIDVPKSENYSSGYFNSFGMDSLGGFSVSHFKEENDKSFGIGYSGSLKSSDSELFGNEISISYKDKDSHLDVSYANPNLDRVKEAWSGDVVGRMRETLKYSINNSISEIKNYIKNPTLLYNIEEELEVMELEEVDNEQELVIARKHKGDEAIQKKNKKGTGLHGHHKVSRNDGSEEIDRDIEKLQVGLDTKPKIYDIFSMLADIDSKMSKSESKVRKLGKNIETEESEYGLCEIPNDLKKKAKEIERLDENIEGLIRDANEKGGVIGKIFTNIAAAMKAKKDRMLDDRRDLSYQIKEAAMDSLVSYGKGGMLSGSDVPIQVIKNIAYKFNQKTDFKGDISDIKTYISGFIATGGQYISKAFVKMVGQDSINKYIHFRDNIAHTDRQKELIDFAAISLLSEGFGIAGEIGYGIMPKITIPKPITVKGYEVDFKIGYKFTDLNELNLTSSENLTHHFKKHQKQFPRAFIRNEQDYLASAQNVIDNGYKVTQFNDGMQKTAYIKFAYSNKGQFPKVPLLEPIFEIVSVKPDGTISTYHLVSKSDLANLLNNNRKNFNFKIEDK